MRRTDVSPTIHRATLALALVTVVSALPISGSRVSRTASGVRAAVGGHFTIHSSDKQQHEERQDASKGGLLEMYGRLPMSFEANQGQTDPSVQFLSNGRGYTLFLTPTQAVMTLRRTQRSNDTNPLPGLRTGEKKDLESATTLRMALVDGNPAPRVEGIGELPGKSNYLIGKDPNKWHTNVATYAKVKYRDIYPGVDLVYYGSQQQLEYDFIVSAGADPAKIALDIQGANGLELDADGGLVMRTALGDIHQRKPRAYQELRDGRREINAGYVLANSRTVGFQLDAYDKNLPLIIDPVLIYSTYLGGGGDDRAFGISVDATGNVYVTGDTLSTNFPTTVGSFQSAGAGGAFVTKIDPGGSTLIYSTYLGGISGTGIAVDANGNAYLTGATGSNFPTTVGAFQTTSGGGSDAFAVKLDPGGSALVYSTYLGGSGFEQGQGIAVDSAGNAYVTGYTLSTNFPTTVGAFQTTSGGGFDAYAVKIDPSGSALVYSTYLGGSGRDQGSSIAVDANGDAYVAGFTGSTNFATTVGAFQTTKGAFNDAFVTKLNLSGSLIYATYLGGGGFDEGWGIAVDVGGNAYVTGITDSTNFPTIIGAGQTTYGGGGDAFVTKLNPRGSALVYSTYLGGSALDYSDMGLGIAVDSTGNTYVTGRAGSNFPTTAGAFQAMHGGTWDAFVAKLDSSGSVLVYSSYLGGNGIDSGQDIAVDANGDVYVTGYTVSTDFPTNGEAFQTTYGGGLNGDAFVAKIGQATLAISINNIPLSASYGGSFTPTYSYTGDGVTSTTSNTTGTCTESTGTINFVGVGTCTLVAHATATANFPEATGSSQSFSIGQASPTISISNIPASAAYGGNFTPTFSYAGDGATSVSSNTTGTCTVSGAVVTFIHVGTCTLVAHATATANVAAATGSAQSFTIGQPTISIDDIPSNAVYGGSFTPTYSYAGDGKTSTSSNTTTVCTVSNKGVVGFVNGGTCALVAHATATANVAAVTGSPQSFTVNAAPVSISIKNVPNAPKSGGSFKPMYAYAGDGLTSVTSNTTTTCTVSGATVRFIAAGTCTLVAHATATTRYQAATGAPQSLVVK
jgi:beta-propeller repeat-containing protein